MTKPLGIDFENNDVYLRREVPRVQAHRSKLGLEGLVGGLRFIVINTEPDRQYAAVEELVRFTGLELAEAFQDAQSRTCVLKAKGSADFLVRARVGRENPFKPYNLHPKSKHMPNTRLETFAFEVQDLEKYVSIQQARGVAFLTDHIVHSENYSFIQTHPSALTGNSLGFVQWHGRQGEYHIPGSAPMDWKPARYDSSHRANIKELDHAATRVRAEDRDAAIVEFMELTNYDFDMAIYVEALNSITNVARLSPDDFAMVFTSGISPYIDEAQSGPTEKFIKNYGTRVHHMAFRTENIEATFRALKEDGMDFLIDLVGSPDEGLKQTFTMPSENTLLVNEYILRYGDFDGFFTKSNVALLTEATAKQ